MSATENTVGAVSKETVGAAKTDEVDDAFELYDLRVEVICPPGARIMCGAKPGDHFLLHGEMMYLPPNQGISIYSLASVLPLLAAKQRITDANDWMSTDAEVACPDPGCGSRLRVERVGRRRFRHGEVSVVELRRGRGEKEEK
ncbi:hypothetical protein CVT24_006839 [Panaeolus cyanescens]|uniref:TIGR04076 family protein n=1 Tax=Panaeolus cyanescens TaxID=181874 RepID=A0A409YRZ7_9AGAR|nr:hypothetical protein CVT24_006839 [Panaeolus cyanescens]